tara:strand:- start:1904 stop:2059 length:156 start_codon:yes stop_codon:yes gene_type:complete
MEPVQTDISRVDGAVIVNVKHTQIWCPAHGMTRMRLTSTGIICQRCFVARN